MLSDLPVLGICGWSGAGKTTLIEAVLPRLLAKGLSVAVVKHTTHELDLDREGTDSERLFRAGADVVVRGPAEGLLRTHEGKGEFSAALRSLAGQYDLVLVEGGKSAAIPKVWLAGPEQAPPPPDLEGVLRGEGVPPLRREGILPSVSSASSFRMEEDKRQRKKHAGETPTGRKGKMPSPRGSECPEPPPDLEGVLASIPWEGDRPATLMAMLEPYLNRLWLATPLYACVLIGGKSTRMGRPKHLLRKDGGTWLERTVGLLRSKAQTVAVIGEGALPETLGDLVRLADAPDARGPMAGILAAMRWAPRASWLVAACDLPALSGEALDWLLATRAPGRWATLPRLEAAGRVEPLLAHYDFRARALLEELAAGGNFRLQDLSQARAVYTPSPPAGLAEAWRNVNTPEDLGQDHESTM
jgi:molybdopterin-guanine dinucleotide biosynthesis protein MobB